MKYAKGICWVDDTRIPFVDESDVPNDMDKTHLDGRNFYTQVYNGFMYQQNKEGRYTPSLLVCDDMLNDGKTYGNLFKQTRNKDTDGGTGNSIVRGHKEGESNGVFDNGTSSSRFYDLDKWFDKVINEIC
jgi:hypothetical protein